MRRSAFAVDLLPTIPMRASNTYSLHEQQFRDTEHKSKQSIQATLMYKLDYTRLTSNVRWDQ